MSKREYSKPALSSSSKFERRGLLASCCQTEGQSCSASVINPPIGAPQQACFSDSEQSGNVARFQNAQNTGFSTT